MNFVECVPNFSEGQNTDTIQHIVDTARAFPTVKILDVHSDPTHNRSVLTYVVPAQDAVDVAFAVTQAAVNTIDIRTHTGAHPRIGALDVFPFVPVGDTPMSTCVGLAHKLGDRLARDLSLPVYFYESAALLQHRRNLATIRRGELFRLADSMENDPPDRGPARLHPSAGAIAVGARLPLIAFNVYLNTTDLAVARAIARDIREQTGGLPTVKALGLAVGGPAHVQVSMNLTDYTTTSLSVVMARMSELAQLHGITISHSELVGLVPLEAILETAGTLLKLQLDKSQILDLRLLENS